jgi:molybdate transport system regulatory protein
MSGSLLPGELRVRILLGPEIAMGPGKADLLEAIQRVGSISGAGRELGMSYRRAWQLVSTMNTCFREPLVETSKGGSEGGGATLTPLGEAVLASYQKLLARAQDQLRPEIAAFKREYLTAGHRPRKQ